MHSTRKGCPGGGNSSMAWRATSYSVCIQAAAMGTAQPGLVHSVFTAAANILFPNNLLLSLNTASSARMPNGIALSVPPGTSPFSALHPGMPVLFGAQRLTIDAINCSLDLSHCPTWNPHIEHPEDIDMEIVKRNEKRLASVLVGRPHRDGVANRHSELSDNRCHLLSWSPEINRGVDGTHLVNVSPPDFPGVLDMAEYLSGRGIGLTPAGDDILAGWMAVGWLLYGPEPGFLAACQQIVEVAKRQTHLLSQCWLGYAAEGNVAEPIGRLLDAMARDDEARLAASAKAVLAMGATSGRDVIQGILLGLFPGNSPLPDTHKGCPARGSLSLQ